jgi:type II secretory pathway pseudopilin PulG
MNVKRWLLLILALSLLLPLIAFGVRYRQSGRQAQEREAAFQQALQSYAARFKRGTTRREIEAYLRESGTPFSHLCCMGMNHSAWDTLVKIGEEKPARFCSEQYVYIGFEFVSDRPGVMPEAEGSDTLTSVRLFRPSTGCL